MLRAGGLSCAGGDINRGAPTHLASCHSSSLADWAATARPSSSGGVAFGGGGGGGGAPRRGKDSLRPPPRRLGWRGKESARLTRSSSDSPLGGSAGGGSGA